MPNKYATIFLVFLLFCGCHVTDRLGNGEKLYKGATLVVHAGTKKERKVIRRELKSMLQPKPNATLFGFPYRLWIYQKAGPEPHSKLRKWIKEKLGEPPVLYDPQMTSHVTDAMVGRMHNKGFFQAAVDANVNLGEKTARVRYIATALPVYTISSIEFPTDSSLVSQAIGYTEKGTLLHPGDRYDLDMMLDERERIDNELKNEGFYFFRPDYLLYKADSLPGARSVKLRLTVKKDVPLKATIPYYYERIVISTARRRDSARVAHPAINDTLGGYVLVLRDSSLKTSTIVNNMFIRKNQLYSRKAYVQTLSRLMGMGVFRLVNITFSDTIVNGLGRLTATVTAYPTYKRSLQIEVEAVTKSNNYTGPATTLSYRNRNVFRGAELMLINLNGSFETQFTGIQKGFNSYEIGTNLQLFFPKFIAPFRIRNVSSQYLPRTKIELGLRNLNRVLYFSMNAFNFSYGYTWKETALKEHVLNPVSISYARLVNQTDIFKQLLSENPFLRNSFEEQFVLGGNYAFTYNSLVNNNKPDQFYFNGQIDLSGNLLGLAQNAMNGRNSTHDQPHTLFGDRYSQYVKAAVDFRYYDVFNKNHRLTNRIIVGAGFPYGNSLALPYIKQFFSGGSNSIRAFLPRTVGPGGYKAPDSTVSNIFLDKGGDIKLEANVEYRFTIISALKGALFVDAGNVWLLHRSDQFPEGEFHFNTFMTQIAVGTGFGLRVDVDYFVIRLDLGFPLRKPYLEEGYRWVVNNIHFGNPTWRKQNFVLNIAIGYPF